MLVKKFFSSLSGLILFLPLAHAQFDIRNFPLDSFKLPELDRRALSIGGSLIGYFSRSDVSKVDRQTLSSNFNPDLRIFYDHYFNRADLQADYNFAVYPSFITSHYKRTNPDSSFSKTSFSPDILFSGFRRKFKGEYFTEAGGLVQIQLSSSRNTYSSDLVDYKTMSSSQSADIRLPVGLGKGRIEPVSDLMLALFTLQDAVTAGVDPSTVHPEEVIAFAQLMSTLRNERIFDSRKKRIAEFKGLYGFMQDKNWIVPNDPAFFTVLTDNWLYDIYRERLSGKQLRFLLTPSVNLFHAKGNDIFNDDYSDNQVGLSVRAEYNRYKPVNIHRDIFHAHSLILGYKQLPTDLLLYNSGNDYSLAFNNTFGRGWYPNSRTYITTTLDLDYYLTSDLKEDVFVTQDDIHTVRTSLNANCSYFISYRTRLNASAGLSYDYHTGLTVWNGELVNINTSKLYGSINASILVNIF